MAEGLIFRDSDSPANRTTIEFSDEVPPTAPSTWNKVIEVRSLQLNGQEAARIDLTHLESTTVETGRALAELGGMSATANWVPTATSGGANETHAELFDLWISGQQRWFRWTFPKVDPGSTSGAVIQFAGEVSVANPSIGGHTEPFEFSLSFTIRGDFTFTPEQRPA